LTCKSAPSQPLNPEAPPPDAYRESHRSPGGGAQRRTLLHGLISDYKQTGGAGGALTTTATGPVSYMGPAPPAENPAHPHKYVEILYEQPAGFAIPASQRSATQARMGFNMATFATAANLSAPIAANYFQVTG
jgi:phosphatidylethanolamine-binding protein